MSRGQARANEENRGVLQCRSDNCFRCDVDKCDIVLTGM